LIVRIYIEKLEETKSSGPDQIQGYPQIHPKFLKETAKNIAVPLENFF
jgi:hypothetical protein